LTELSRIILIVIRQFLVHLYTIRDAFSVCNDNYCKNNYCI